MLQSKRKLLSAALLTALFFLTLPAAESEVVAEAPVVEEVEEVAAEPVEKTPRIEFTATKIDINDPTDKYAKKGGLFGRIFGKK